MFVPCAPVLGISMCKEGQTAKQEVEDSNRIHEGGFLVGGKDCSKLLSTSCLTGFSIFECWTFKFIAGPNPTSNLECSPLTP